MVHFECPHSKLIQVNSLDLLIMKKNMKKIFSFIILFGLSLFSQAETIYVNGNASGSDDGSSWDNAYTSFSAALLAANSGDEIWLAAGTYRLGSLTSFYEMKEGVAIYGGFSGFESTLEERDFNLNHSILSGDVSANDSVGDFSSNRNDNALHVLKAADNIGQDARLDGLTVRGGNTFNLSAAGDDSKGGGLLCKGSPTIVNCKFEDNFGLNGGGIAVQGPATENLIIENCLFMGNKADDQGGGLYINQANIFLDLNDCEFINNIASEAGGGLSILSASLDVTNCSFEGNQIDDSGLLGGGGAYIKGFISPSIVDFNNCTFDQNLSLSNGAAIMIAGDSEVACNLTVFNQNASSFNGGAVYCSDGEFVNLGTEYNGNIAQNGGGIYFGGDSLILDQAVLNSNVSLELGGAIFTSPFSNVVINRSTIEDNNALSGGGFYFDNSVAEIRNSIFKADSSTNQGGAVYAKQLETIFINCIFEKNYGTSGGGILCADGNQTIAIHSTFYSNESFSIGPAIHVTNNSSLLTNNSIYWNNSSTAFGQIGNTSDIEPIVEYCLVENGFDGEGNINSMPFFADADNGDFQLLILSPAINAGTSELPNYDGVNLDFNGLERDNEPDMGPYEFPVFIPLAPSNLFAQSTNQNSILLTWLDNASDENGFILERSVDGNQNFEMLVALGEDVESYEDTDVVENIIYFYRIQSVRDGEFSSFSNETFATLELYAPNTPLDFDTLEVGFNTVQLIWTDDSADEENFVLQRADDLMTGNWVTIANDIPANTTSFTDTGLNANTTYGYQIKAVNSVGESDWASLIVMTKVNVGLVDDIDVKWNLYPNPTDGILNLDLNEMESKLLGWKVYDLTGKMVLSSEMDIQQRQLTLNVESLNSGEYFLLLQGKEQNSGKFFMVK